MWKEKLEDADGDLEVVGLGGAVPSEIGGGFGSGAGGKDSAESPSAAASVR